MDLSGLVGVGDANTGIGAMTAAASASGSLPGTGPTAAALLNASLEPHDGVAPNGEGDAVNSTAPSVCASIHAPSMLHYFSAIGVPGQAIITAGAVVVILVILLYVDTLRRILRRTVVPASTKTHTAFVVSVYPVVALASLCAMMVPRAQLLAEAVTQGVFMAAVYQLWCLLVAYCGGEAELIRKVKPNMLNTRVGPCCCWPCCLLPQPSVEKCTLTFLRVLVLQLPVVQGMVYLILLVMWAEEESLYEVNYMYLQPIVVMSILTGIWGLLMTIKMLSTVLAGFLIPAKFLALQAVLLLAKFQGLGARALAWYSVLPCQPPLTPSVYANLTYNSAMLVEMLLLAMLARAIYIRELPDIRERPTPPQICVLDANNQLKDAIETNKGAFNNNNYVQDENSLSYKF